MMQPCLICLHAISVVAPRRRPPPVPFLAALKEMMQPCQICLHIISLVARRALLLHVGLDRRLGLGDGELSRTALLGSEQAVNRQ